MRRFADRPPSLGWIGVCVLTALLALACPATGITRGEIGQALRLMPAAIFEPDSIAAAVAPLTLSATLAHAGYVGVTLAGPPGAAVQLSEELPDGTDAPIQTVVLAADATLVPDALTWNCERRQRELVATTLAPAAPQQASVTVTTPSCSTRLATAIKRTARAGRTAVITLKDRWRIGGLTVKICASPPGAGPACGQWQLGAGQRTRVVRLRVPRPGGWRVSVETAFGYRAHATVWVRPHDRRLRVLAVGDSEMQILDGFLTQDLAPHRVKVTSDARISTGLTKPFMFNWETHARAQAATLHPDATVVFMGANDGFSVSGPNGRSVDCCSSAWSAGYANLVAEMMRSYLRGNAGRVYWFLLPTPRPGNFLSVFDAVNSGIRQAASRFPGRAALVDANAFFTPGNRYRNYMTYHGHGVVIHEADGVHLSSASDEIAAHLLVRQMIADRVIR